MDARTQARIKQLQKTVFRKPNFGTMGMAERLHGITKEEEKARRLFLWALIGANRTGKTSTLVQMVKAWRKANPGKKVIAYDPQGFLQKAGLVDIVIYAHTKNWAKLLCQKNGVQYEGMGGRMEFKFGDSLIIFDDFRQLHPNHQLNLELIQLLGLRTKMNVDIFYCVWNPINLLDQMSGFTNRYSIFYTMSQQGGFSNKIPNYLPCQESAKLINKYVTHYNLLDRGEDLYPHFPYFIVRDDYERKVTAINIDKKMLMAIAA